MVNKENIQQEAENETAAKAPDSETASSVPNPFEDGIKTLSKEELESVEQFKEAQTERD